MDLRVGSDEVEDVEVLGCDNGIGQGKQSCGFVYAVVHLDRRWVELALYLSLQIWQEAISQQGHQ